MNGADVVARILKQEGVDFMGIIPSNALEESAAKAGIRPLIFRQERVGVNLADGYARVTNGKGTGVFSMQAGPGAENAYAGVAQAYSDSVPMLMLPASVAMDRLGVRPTFSPSRAYESVTKWSSEVRTMNSLPDMMRRAFSQLRNGRPNPVLLEIPRDILRGELPGDDIRYTNVVPVRSMGDLQNVKEAARMLLSAKRPIIQAGQGVLYAEATDELLELAEITQTPVMTTMAGKSAFPENHALALGTRSGTTTGMVVHFMNNSDLVFGVGTSFTRIHHSADLFDDKVIVHITNDPDDVNKDYSPDQAIVGDAKLVLRQVIDEVKAQLGSQSRKDTGSDDPAVEIKAVKDEWMKEWLPKLTSNETPINPYRAINDLLKTVDLSKSIVTHDSGSPRDQMMPFFETTTPRGFIAWGKSTQLGYSLGLALGAKMAAPEKLAVNVLGDYAFGMVGLDIETAVRERIPILTVVLNNKEMGIYGDNAFPTANDLYGMKYTEGDYVKVAEAMGAYGERVEQPQEIVPAFKRAIEKIEAGQTALVEIMTDGKEKSFSHRG